MKVLLLDIDSKLPNLALHKIAMWHEQRGDVVEWDMPMMMGIADRSYASCVFTKNRHKVEAYKNMHPELLVGGSGWDLTTKLLPEIEIMKPRLNYGFTTRGCIRKCSFCIVPAKEGIINIVGDLMDLWDGVAKKVVVMDNNILALPDHFEKVCQQAIERKIKLDFNQGLDHRLITPKVAKIMSQVSHAEYHLALDRPELIRSADKAIKLLREHGINRCTWYVLVGYDTTPEEDLLRLNYLRDMNQRAYVQRYETHFHEPFYIGLALWVNQPHLYITMTWEEFLDYPRADHRRLKESILSHQELKGKEEKL